MGADVGGKPRRPTPDTLLDMALERAPAGRNNAGFWLAQQLHANGCGESDADAVMREFVAAVGGADAGKGSYTEREARATLKAEYRRPPKDPWPTAGGQPFDNPQARRALKRRRLFPTAPPAPRDPGDADSAARFAQERKRLKRIAGTPAADYLVQRGIPEALARRAACAYAPAWGGLGPAVVFPLRDESGRAVAAAGRAITPQSPDKRHRTYGPKSGGAFLTPGALSADPVAITEAPIDAMSLALAGLPAVALCGVSAMPAWLIRRLSAPPAGRPGFSRTVLMAFDADAAGDAAADRLASALSLCRVRRLRPQGAKDWNAVLTEAGLDALRAAVDAVLADTAWEPHLGLNAPESQSDATVAILGDGERAGACQACGASVELRVYPDSGGAWAWYNCERCDDFAAVELRDTEHGAPESNPAAAAAREGAPQDRRESESALAERIRAALAGRPLPIAIRPGEAVTDVAAYAAAEARSALSNSPQHARAALERLALLGISADSTDKN